ncbi:ATP-binding protein [Actinomadura verrucosospora]|uniref:Signal transduction histidine-protein kinase/phosphatase MprB n=1 Tax=Actinomadura verrucosospora TaxID=46165 RepID=A0A7D4A7G5_ACTVE|nr:ATP-binding protein [Actinomadura verrucosospora]QKG24445.1 two component system histidine kinase [Actinomadura verrucosospora]
MRGALARIATAVTAMVALSFVVPLGLLVGQMAHDRALSAAAQQAASLEPVLTVTAAPASLADAVGSTPAGAAGRLALHPAQGPAIGSAHASDADVGKARALRRAFTAAAAGGTVLLTPALLDSDRVAVIEVYVPDAELNRGVARSRTILGLVAVALVLVSVAMADRLAVRVVKAADGLANAVTRVGDGDLEARVAPGGPPELRAAGTAFNRMADRLVRLLEAERESAADLSHRLRTPLTALRVNLNGLAANPADPARMAHSQDALSRLEETVDEIIATARRPAAERPSCDAAAVVRRRMEFWSALAADQGRDCEVLVPDGAVRVPVGEDELVAAVDALLGNVFRHTRQRTALSVTLHQGRYSTGLLVGDAGPGIPDAEAALRRGASGTGSTGLGLDIARRLAESTGGSLKIGEAALGGAQIELWLRTESRPPSRRAGRRPRRSRARKQRARE